ncbi:hypothetical protein EN816_00665 [Mesorhizobium sp. M8A.F.Ca.ET.173.01.1.1]|nr:hypothetical protein EN816_00665 [Mesorhizobium sp. M8A.F.Ca.ET.173.01.1.1]
MTPAGWLCTHKKTGSVELRLRPLDDLPFNRANWDWEPVFRQIRSESEDELYAALLAATAVLAGATSAYQSHASRHRSVGRSKPDPFFTTRIKDFEKATEAARTVLMKYATKAQA